MASFLIKRICHQEYEATCIVDCDSLEEAEEFADVMQTEDFDIKVCPGFYMGVIDIKEMENT